MQIIVLPNGTVRCIYGEAINLSKLGQLVIRRASHVEPDHTGQWLCDLSPVNGPTLGPFLSRSEALTAEHAWLVEYWLVPRP